MMKCLTIIQIALEFGNVRFSGEGKTGEPREKPLGARTRTNNKLNPHRIRESNPGHLCGRRVLSSLRHPCFPYPFFHFPNTAVTLIRGNWPELFMYECNGEIWRSTKSFSTVLSKSRLSLAYAAKSAKEIFSRARASITSYVDPVQCQE